jgi:hypothetical protein
LNRRPLRPELAAPLGVRPLPQLMERLGGSSCSLLSGDVAVLSCCTGALPVSFVGVVRCAVPTRRPSAFQAGHIPSWRESCERYALSSVADVCRWLLLLLSPLLRRQGSPALSVSLAPSLMPPPSRRLLDEYIKETGLVIMSRRRAPTTDRTSGRANLPSGSRSSIEYVCACTGRELS